MNDESIWSRQEIQSPCLRICVIHPQAKICTGCLRTLDEIGAWSRMTDAQRHETMQALPERKPLLAKRRGGRAARLQRDSGN